MRHEWKWNCLKESTWRTGEKSLVWTWVIRAFDHSSISISKDPKITNTRYILRMWRPTPPLLCADCGTTEMTIIKPSNDSYSWLICLRFFFLLIFFIRSHLPFTASGRIRDWNTSRHTHQRDSNRRKIPPSSQHHFVVTRNCHHLNQQLGSENRSRAVHNCVCILSNWTAVLYGKCLLSIVSGSRPNYSSPKIHISFFYWAIRRWRRCPCVCVCIWCSR